MMWIQVMGLKTMWSLMNDSQRLESLKIYLSDILKFKRTNAVNHWVMKVKKSSKEMNPS